MEHGLCAGQDRLRPRGRGRRAHEKRILRAGKRTRREYRCRKRCKPPGGKLYNTSYVFNRSGECLAVYDKTHLFSPMGEDLAFAKGDSLARFSLDGASCALIICYDLRFPELVRTLALPGLDILFVVSQWPDQADFASGGASQARAIENQMFVALCNSCGQAFGTRLAGIPA